MEDNDSRRTGINLGLHSSHTCHAIGVSSRHNVFQALGGGTSAFYGKIVTH